MNNKVAFLTYEVMKKYSDKENKLSQAQIIRKLKDDYDLVCDRKTVSKNLCAIAECKENVRYSEKMVEDGERSYKVKSDWFVEKKFCEQECEYIAESLMKNTDIPLEVSFGILKKLSEIGDMRDTPSDITVCSFRSEEENSIKRENIKIVKEAVKSRRMLYFSLILYFADGRYQLVRNAEGSVAEYIVKPREIIVADGEERVFCELGDTGKYAVFMIGQMYKPVITEIGFEAEEQGADKRYLPKNLAEARFIRYGNREKIAVRVKRERLGEFLNALGSREVKVRENALGAEVFFECIIGSALPLILQFGEDVEAISPLKLRRSVAIENRSAERKYLQSRQYRGSVN